MRSEIPPRLSGGAVIASNPIHPIRWWMASIQPRCSILYTVRPERRTRTLSFAQFCGGKISWLLSFWLLYLSLSTVPCYLRRGISPSAAALTATHRQQSYIFFCCPLAHKREAIIWRARSHNTLGNLVRTKLQERCYEAIRWRKKYT